MRWQSLGWAIAAGLLAALLVLHVTPSGSRPPATSSWAEAVSRASPAVVNIYTSKVVRSPYHPLMDDPLFQQFFRRSPAPQRERIQRSLGSGVIMSADGYLLTNNHVISGATEILVLLADGRESLAKVIGSDPETDLAVLRIELPDLRPIPVGDPAAARVGDVVLAIGNPYGFEQSVSQGIVSALGRFGLQLNAYENFIQTDAAINPGNSGGALVDASGNLLGINTAIYSRSGGSMGIGFAIPVSTGKQVLESIIKTGSVTRGYIGVEPQDITAEAAAALKLSRSSGILVTGVMRGGPAERAGMQPGDIITDIGEQTVPDTSTMLNLIAQLPPGAPAKIKVLRGAKPLELAVVVGKRPKAQPRAAQER